MSGRRQQKCSHKKPAGKTSPPTERRIRPNSKPSIGRRATDESTGPFGNCPYCSSPALARSGFTDAMTQRYVCTSCGRKTTTPVKTSEVAMRWTLPRKKRYIITCAQNATPVHRGFLTSLLIAAKFYDAELVVLPIRYKNPTSQWSQKNQEHEWWDPLIMPYLFAERMMLNKRFMILGDLKIQPTNSSPLSGLDGFSKDASGVVGHPQVAMNTVPTPQHKHAKVMFTTGACTVPNYTDTRAGQIGAFNHSFSALIVELDANDVYYARHVGYKDGAFIDLDLEFSSKGVRKAKRLASLTCGDLHHGFVDEKVVWATFDAPDSLVNLLNPEYVVLHDVINAVAISHHDRDNWPVRFGKWKYGWNDIRAEIVAATKFIGEKVPKTSTAIVVSSNHDRHIARWLREVDFREDPVNTEFYLECALAYVREGIASTSGGIAVKDPFVSYARTIADEHVRFLDHGESFVVDEVEHCLHGDQGPNGSRGTTRNLSHLGVKVTKAHSHSPQIIGGCYSVGTSTGPLEYEEHAPSSHAKAHVVQYASGRRAVIFIVNGKYCLPRPIVKK